MLQNQFACNLFTTFPAEEDLQSLPTLKIGNGYLLKFQYSHTLRKIHYEAIFSAQETVPVAQQRSLERRFPFLCFSWSGTEQCTHTAQSCTTSVHPAIFTECIITLGALLNRTSHLNFPTAGLLQQSTIEFLFHLGHKPINISKCGYRTSSAY